MEWKDRKAQGEVGGPGRWQQKRRIRGQLAGASELPLLDKQGRRGREGNPRSIPEFPA